MKKRFGLTSLTKEELKKFYKMIDEYDDIQSLKRDVLCLLEEKNLAKKSINERFNIALMKKLQLFDSHQFHVLEQNRISNLQQLMDCDLDSLVGVTPSMKREFDWVRKFYDLRSLVEEDSIQKRKEKNR